MPSQQELVHMKSSLVDSLVCSVISQSSYRIYRQNNITFQVLVNRNTDKETSPHIYSKLQSKKITGEIGGLGDQSEFSNDLYHMIDTVNDHYPTKL